MKISVGALGGPSLARAPCVGRDRRLIRGDDLELSHAPGVAFVDGKMIKTVERFRAYGSYEEAFTDWSRLMASNPRFAGVLSSGGSIENFAKNMQRAGYATDPNYASKLTSTNWGGRLPS